MTPHPLTIATAVAILSSHAQARELSPRDLATIQTINTRENKHAYPANMDPCQNYAVAKAGSLLLNGFSPDEVRLAVVRDEFGKGHEVAVVLRTLNGKPGEIVMDDRWPWTVSREALEQYGYQWLVEAPPMPKGDVR